MICVIFGIGWAIFATIVALTIAAVISRGDRDG